MITINIDTKRVEDRFGRMLRRLPTISEEIAKEIAEEYAESLTKISQIAFTFPRRYMGISKKGSIRAVKLEKKHTWGVKMPYYALYVDKGRRPGKWPPNVAQIRRWARLARMSTWYLRKTIGKHGTKPRKFIWPAVMMSRYRIKDIIRNNMRKLR